MNAWIAKKEVLLLALPLPEPFHLGFGVLHRLPRVLLVLTIEQENGNAFQAIGEASIDFPFSSYDAWDMYHALTQEPLVGRSVFDREDLLDEAWNRRLQDGMYAAHAALNMALDDAYGRVTKQSIHCLYTDVDSYEGRILQSIGIMNNRLDFSDAVRRIFQSGRIPKVKCDEEIHESLMRLSLTSQHASAFQMTFAADFNATLSFDVWQRVLSEWMKTPHAACLQFVEQPLHKELGMEGLVRAKEISQHVNGPLIVADESFLTEQDAVLCGLSSVGMNLKIQKVGGIRRACQLEEIARHVANNHGIVSMIGGTFPTALGRAYDQHAACVIKSATLPSDGWQPASDWFSGDLHLILESFCEPAPGVSRVFTGDGLGCQPNWDHVRQFVVQNPEREYRRIRETGKGEHIVVHTEKMHEPYAMMYERLSGRTFAWNLP